MLIFYLQMTDFLVFNDGQAANSTGNCKNLFQCFLSGLISSAVKARQAENKTHAIHNFTNAMRFSMVEFKEKAEAYIRHSR